MWGIRGKKSRRVLIAAAIVAGALLIAPAIIARIVRWRLQSMVSAQLKAELLIGHLSYQYPYGVEVSDAALLANGPEGTSQELLRVRRLWLKLAQSPFRSGPLVIESISIDHPSIHLIRAEGGLMGGHGLARSAPEKQQDNRHWKLSDMFHLRQLNLTGGEVIYEDRSRAGARPLVWRNLNVTLDTNRQSGSEYSFHFIADNQPLAILDATGTADIDSLMLKLDPLRLSVNLDPSQKHSAIPPEYQRVIDDLNIRGRLVVVTRATLPLSDPRHATYGTTLELSQASAKLPKSGSRLDRLAADVRLGDGAGRPWAQVASLDATTGDASLHLSGGKLALDPAAMRWTLQGLDGRIDAARGAAGRTHGSLEFSLLANGPVTAANLYPITATLHLLPRDFSVQPSVMAAPIDQVAETELTLKSGIVSARGLRASFGNDVWYLKQAEFDLTDLPHRLGVSQAQGAITFGTPRSTYPKAIEQALAPLDPSGPWFFGGNAAIALASNLRTDYDILVHTARGRLNLADRRIPIYSINAAANVSPAAIQLLNFDAGAFQGQLSLTGTIGLVGATHYELDGSIRGAQLNDVARALSKAGDKPAPMAGRANLKLRLAGLLPDDGRSALESLHGAGDIEVKNGDFWKVPVMKEIADNSNVRTAMTVGEAAAVFTVGHRAVHLSHAAVSAPALGVEGHGDVAFNGQLKIDCITTVLGNWGEKFDVGDDGTVGRAVDQLQRTLNGVTQAAVMNIHVSGSPNHPAIDAIPVPFLAAPTAQFMNFLKGGTQQGGGLLGYVKDKPAPSESPRTPAK